MELTILRISIGLVMITFGVDQFIRPKGWVLYIPSQLTKLLPMSKEAVIKGHASGNISLGLVLLSNLFPAVSYLATFLWWLSILPFAFYYNWRIGMRDLAIIAGIVVLILS